MFFSLKFQLSHLTSYWAIASSTVFEGSNINGRAEIQEVPLIPTHTFRECYPKNGPNAQ